MGDEYRLRFETRPRGAVAYAPDEFLMRLPKSLPSLECTESVPPSTPGYEYRQRDAPDPHGWPDVVVYVTADGFHVVEYNRHVGTSVLGHLVKYALDFAMDGSVKVQEG